MYAANQESNKSKPIDLFQMLQNAIYARVCMISIKIERVVTFGGVLL